MRQGAVLSEKRRVQVVHEHFQKVPQRRISPSAVHTERGR